MASAIRNRQDAIDFLYSRIDYERISASLSASDFKLDRMRNLLQRIDEPQRVTPVVHIAGTKGKGSTAGMVASGLQAAGYRVGLFTSPHLDRFEERVQIDGEPIDEALLVELVDRLRAVALEIDRQADGLSPTFFELTTALAWLSFSARQVDIGVLEVGLGGRLDSTNVCCPVAAVITTISRDHTHILGSRLEEIAREKAGILKPGVPTVSGVLAPRARREITAVAGERGCPLLQIGEDFDVATTNGHRVEIVLGERWKLTCDLENARQHHCRNAATAGVTLWTLREHGWRVPDEAIRLGIQRYRAECRLQTVSESPAILVDAAHNWASIGALIQSLSDVPQRPRVLIFSTSRDKDACGMLRRLVPHFDSIIVTEFRSSPRAMPVGELVRAVRHITTVPVHVRERPDQAIAAATRLCSDEGLICAAGSFFLAAEVRALVERKVS